MPGCNSHKQWLKSERFRKGIALDSIDRRHPRTCRLLLLLFHSGTTQIGSNQPLPRSLKPLHMASIIWLVTDGDLGRQAHPQRRWEIPEDLDGHARAAIRNSVDGGGIGNFLSRRRGCEDCMELPEPYPPLFANPHDGIRSRKHREPRACSSWRVVIIGIPLLARSSQTNGGALGSSSCLVTSPGEKITLSRRLSLWLRMRRNSASAFCCSNALPNALWTCDKW